MKGVKSILVMISTEYCAELFNPYTSEANITLYVNHTYKKNSSVIASL